MSRTVYVGGKRVETSGSSHIVFSKSHSQGYANDGVSLWLSSYLDVESFRCGSAFVAYNYKD